MSDSESSVNLCFICNESLSEGEVVLVKERGIRTLLESSVKLNNRVNKKLLKDLSEVSVHSGCQKRYNNSKLIAAAIRRGETAPKSVKGTRASTENFNFKENCFLCGDEITTEFIKAQKKPAKKQITTITVEKLTLKGTILKAAEQRGDEWALKIIERISDDTDLVALDARYHLFCQRKLYKAPSKGLKRGGRCHSNVDEAMEQIFAYLEENSEECQFAYEELIRQIQGDYCPDIRTIKARLFQKYGEDIVIAETANKTTVVCFKNTGHKILNNAWYSNKKLDPKEERLRVVKTAADIIRKDIREQVYDLTQYTPSDNFLHNINSVIHESVRLLFETVILKNKRNSLDKWNKKCVALSHALILAVRPRFFISSLLHGIGVYIYQKFGSKHLVELLSTLGFSSNYNETSLLEMSAILRPDKLTMEKDSFLQFVFDNADFNVNTLDGLGTFHAMGGIMIVTPYESIAPDQNIARVKRCTVSQLLQQIPSIELEAFKKVDNQGLAAIEIADVDKIHPLPEDVPSPSDILWLYGKGLKKINVPGWNGFMEEATKDKHFKTSKIWCLPFISNPPSQYDTILTALRVACEKGKTYDQKTCFVTFDQPLYIKGKEILANCHDTDLNNVVVRLGGFHLLMSFMGTIGVIMGGSGLKELLSTIYAENSVEKLLTGHAYSRAVRTHTLAHLAIATEVVKTINLTEEDESAILTAQENEQYQAFQIKFRNSLHNFERNGPTAKLWVQYFHMVTLIKKFIEAERMGNWALHLETVQKMLPYFHAADHFFYAKCAHLYLQDMLELEGRMDPIEYHRFTTEGYFTARRTNKFWSGLWSDMTIEQTLMKTMKSSGGLARGRGMTDSVLTRWTLGMVYLQNICYEVETYCNITSATSEQHVDMRHSRITRDEADTEKLRHWFSQHRPFPKTELIISISSGLVRGEDVNCHMALQIGREGLSKVVGKNFEQVKFKRKNKVVSLSSAVNSVTVGDRKVTINPLTLFHRLCILKQSDENLKQVLTYELSPFPMSLFNEEGMRKGTKSSLYSAFTPIQMEEVQGATKFVVVDGGHLLHKVVWPRSTSFGSIAARYIQYLKTHYGSNVAVIFDGYPSDTAQRNTKSYERVRRAKALSSLSSPAVIFDETTIAQVAQEKFLANEGNKIRFIDVLKTCLERAKVQVQQAIEDADTVIVTTAISMASQYDIVTIAGEDIDLVVLLTGLEKCPKNIFFQKCGRGKTPDVFYSTTSLKCASSAGQMLFIHAFSGCDTTSVLFGHGKNKFLSTIQKQPDLMEKTTVFLDSDATPEQVTEAGESFIVALYGGNSNQNLSDLRYQLFARAAAKTNFNLARIPPTQDAARLHSLRSYHQVQKWLGIERNPLDWGWVLTPQGLTPKKMENDPAPPSLLQLISCSCKKGCRNACSCRKSGLKCSLVCTNCSGQSCENVPELILDDDSPEVNPALEELDEISWKETVGEKNEQVEETVIEEQEEKTCSDSELEDIPGPSKRQKL